MTAARYDITIDQGSDFALELIVKDSGTARSFDDDTNNEGQILRWGARARYRKTLEATTEYLLGAAIDTSTIGKITVSHAHNANSADPAPAGTYLYDLEVYQYNTTTNAELSVTRLIGGSLTLKREVTR